MKLLFCFLFVYVTIIHGADIQRSYQIDYNPNCTLSECFNNDSSVNLIYIKSIGSDDIEHILYSTIGSFTVLLFKTSLDAELSIDWDNLVSKNETLMQNSISLSGNIMYSCAYMMPLIYEFNDASGMADMTKVNQNLSNWRVRETSAMKWVYRNTSESLNEEANAGVLEGIDLNDASSNGSFKFALRYFGKKVRDTTLPHALLSPETSSIDFIIDSINATFKDSKFAITFLIVQNALDLVKLVNRRSLDDEYTPGTFQQWTLEAHNEAKIQSYLQWKPIFYFTKKRSFESSTLTKHYSLETRNDTLPLSIASTVFFSNETITALNISFGIQGNEKDGFFYPKYNFTAWTFTLGLGEPEKEKMSSVVSLVIFIGFGLPAAIIAIGLSFMLLKKIRGPSSNYESL